MARLYAFNMILICDPDLTREVIRPIKIKHIYEKETVIKAVPELYGLAKTLEVMGDPLSDEALSLIWRECADYLCAIGYADDRFKARRNLIFAKEKANENISELGAPIGCENLTTIDIVGDECSATVIDGKIVSVAAAYKTEDAYEICVEAAQRYRGQGFAAANVTVLSDALLSRGDAVRYLCAETNERSKKVALSAGFCEIGKCYEYIVRRKG